MKEDPYHTSYLGKGSQAKSGEFMMLFRKLAPLVL